MSIAAHQMADSLGRDQHQLCCDIVTFHSTPIRERVVIPSIKPKSHQHVLSQQTTGFKVGKNRVETI
jgi:hypothetical protein